MNASCEACARGPTKVDGHAGLMVHSLGNAGMFFKCRQCGLAWMRSYSRDGSYGWTRPAGLINATAGVGIMMPSAGASPAAVAEDSGRNRDALDHWLAIRRSWKRTSRLSH